MRILPHLRAPRAFRTLRYAASLFAVLLAGCLFETSETSGNRVDGGAEDFPNTLGVAMAAHLADHGEWDQFSNVPAIDLGEADSLVAGPEVLAKPGSSANTDGVVGGSVTGATSGAALPKAVAADTVIWDYSDTASLGVARRIARGATALRVRTDTTTVRWDDKARDGAPLAELTLLESRGAEDWRRTSRLVAYRFENTDSAGGFDRAAFYERLPRDGGAQLHKLLVVKPGPDGDFAAKADNVPVYYGRMRTLAGDTLDAFEVKDADGDGLLWAPGSDSGLVDVRHKQTGPALRPAVALFTQKLRAVLFKDGARTYPIAYAENRTDKDGRRVSIAVRGTRADSAFGPGDTVTVVVRAFPSSDSEGRVLERTGRYVILLSVEPGDHAGNTLLRFSMETRWREGAFPKGALAVTRLDFIPDEPIHPGRLDLAGTLKVEAELAKGGTGSVEARLQDRRIEAGRVELRLASGTHRFKAEWDGTDGRLLRLESLPD
jgi:hypothetical protein